MSCFVLPRGLLQNRVLTLCLSLCSYIIKNNCNSFQNSQNGPGEFRGRTVSFCMEKELFGVELWRELELLLILYCSYCSKLYQKAIVAMCLTSLRSSATSYI
jgi:hypothetical protein